MFTFQTAGQRFAAGHSCNCNTPVYIMKTGMGFCKYSCTQSLQQMNMSGELNAPAALSLEKELLLPMELEVGWALLNQFNESFSS